MEIAEAIEQTANLGIEALQKHRQTLRRGDATTIVLDVLDPLINTARLSFRSHPDIRPLAEGITDRGIVWLIRVFARGVGQMVRSTPASTLRSFAHYLHVAADTIETALAQEEGEVNETLHPSIR